MLIDSGLCYCFAKVPFLSEHCFRLHINEQFHNNRRRSFLSFLAFPVFCPLPRNSCRAQKVCLCAFRLLINHQTNLITHFMALEGNRIFIHKKYLPPRLFLRGTTKCLIYCRAILPIDFRITSTRFQRLLFFFDDGAKVSG